MDLAKRSYTLELLDRDDIPAEDLYLNLKELDTINTLLGGHAVSVLGLKKILGHTKGPVTIADIGCGGGDNLRKMAIWCRKRGVKAQLVGIDLKPDAISYAQQLSQDFPEISYITSDYRDVTESFDITTSALFCHHLTDDQLQHYLVWSKNHSRLGFFINDLHRHSLAYYSIMWLTRLFSKSYLVKNDAPLSVRRGFLRKDWEHNFAAIHLKTFTIQWIWAFRHLVLFRHEN